jgi:uncharacterized protein YjbI with pentapeptide repeats
MALNLPLLPALGPSEDVREYLQRLVAALQEALLDVERASGGVQTIYDLQGRPIVTPEGIYAYQADGSIPVAPDLVQIGTEELVDAAVVLAKIADDAVDSAKIKDAAIISAKIADAAIISAKIGDLAVVTAKIDDLAVNNAKIANLAVDSAKIAALAVGTAKIADLAVTTAKINDLAVTTAKITDLAVTGAKIANATIQAAQIADATITGAKIAAATITAANIANATITGAQIANATIQTANIAGLAVTTALIADAAITSAKIGSLAVLTANIADAAITQAKIANLAVGAAQIIDASIGTAKIVDASITTAKIVNLAIDNSKIANATITGAKIASATITDANIATATITSAKIASLAADKIITGIVGAQTIYLGATSVALDGTNRRIDVTDENSVLRVRMGRLGAGAQNYGIQINDASGNAIVTATGLGLNVVGQNQIARQAYVVSSSQSRLTTFNVATTGFLSIINSGNIAIAPSTEFPYFDVKAVAALRISGGTALTGANFRVRIAGPSGDIIPFEHWLALQQLTIGGDYRTISCIPFGFSMTGLPTGNYVAHLEVSRPYGDGTLDVDHCVLSVSVFKKAI